MMDPDGQLYTVSEIYRDDEYEVVYREGVTTYWQITDGKRTRVADLATILEIERRVEAASQ